MGSRLALIALAVQFLLSFGHFHGGASVASKNAKWPALHDATALAATQLDASDQASLAKAALGPKVFGPKLLKVVRLKTSSDHAPFGHSDDDCAICAVMALANTMLDAAPPLLLSPRATAFSYESVVARFAELGPARVAFQPRAPPIA